MRTSGYQNLSLAVDGCVHKGTAMHEFMHTAGFFHEHQRYDRDEYVTILYENIEEGAWKSHEQAPMHVLVSATP